MRSLPIALITVVACSSSSKPAAPPPPSTTDAAPPAIDAAPPFAARVRPLAQESLRAMVAEHTPESAVVIVVDLDTGGVLAAEGWDAGAAAPDFAATRALVTGSTLKTFTIAAALDAGTVALTDSFDGKTRRYPQGELRDASPHGRLTLTEVLTVSSNTASSRVLDTLGLPKLIAAFRAFHLGDPPTPLPDVTDARSIDAGLLASGELAALPPLQVAQGYAAVFRDGAYLAPGGAPEPAIGAETARVMIAMLEAAVADGATGAKARVPGLRIAGKTGTAGLGDGRMYASFVGSVLDRTPRVVILVGMVVPRGTITGPTAAAPAFARLAAAIYAAPGP